MKHVGKTESCKCLGSCAKAVLEATVKLQEHGKSKVSLRKGRQPATFKCANTFRETGQKVAISLEAQKRV
jgi:hypothetical protein